MQFWRHKKKRSIPVPGKASEKHKYVTSGKNFQCLDCNMVFQHKPAIYKRTIDCRKKEKTVQEYKCHNCQNRFVNKICAIMLVQAGMQANPFASAIDLAGHITKLTENFRGKRLFIKTQRRLILKLFCLPMWSVIRKGIIRKTFHFWKQEICMCSLKA